MMSSNSKKDIILECIREADSLAKDPSNIFKRMGDDKLTRLTRAYEKYSEAINLSICDKDHAILLELSEKKLNVLKRTPEVSEYEIGNEYVTLAEIQKKTNVNASIESYLIAIDIFSRLGDFRKREKYLINVGKLYETIDKKDMAIEFYIKAFNSDSDSNNYRVNIEIARLYVELKKYDEAFKYYETIANECVKNTLLKFSCKEHYMKATLCGICLHGKNFKEKYDEYVRDTPLFQNSMETALLDKIFEAIDNSDLDIFQEALSEYDKLKKFDDTQVQLLLNIKNNVVCENDLL